MLMMMMMVRMVMLKVMMAWCKQESLLAHTSRGAE